MGTSPGHADTKPAQSYGCETLTTTTTLAPDTGTPAPDTTKSSMTIYDEYEAIFGTTTTTTTTSTTTTFATEAPTTSDTVAPDTAASETTVPQAPTSTNSASRKNLLLSVFAGSFVVVLAHLL